MDLFNKHVTHAITSTCLATTKEVISTIKSMIEPKWTKVRSNTKAKGIYCSNINPKR